MKADLFAHPPRIEYRQHHRQKSHPHSQDPDQHSPLPGNLLSSN